MPGPVFATPFMTIDHIDNVLLIKGEKRQEIES